MNTTTKLTTLLVAVLALAACESNNDFPAPDSKVESDIYVLIGSPADDCDVVCSLDGDTIYRCPMGSEIVSMQADGSDWYALVKVDDRSDEIIRNGRSVITTSLEITEFCVSGGRVFSLQRAKKGGDNYQWSYWVDGRPRYQLPGTRSYSYHNLVVKDYGSYAPVALGFLEATEVGSAMLFDYIAGDASGLERVELANGYVMLADHEPGGLIYCFEDSETGRYMYSWQLENHELDFLPIQVGVFNHLPCVLGNKATKQTVHGVTREPVVLVDGKEMVLKADFLPKGLENGVKMRQHGGDLYVLATGQDWSCVFKNLKPIEVKALIPNPVFDFEQMKSLANCVYKDFVVVDRQ